MSIKAMQYALEVLQNFVEDPRCEAHRLAAVHFLKQAIAEAEKPPHTDHPMRHWDKTCPACVYESDISQEPVDETTKDRYEPDEDIYDIWKEKK